MAPVEKEIFIKMGNGYSIGNYEFRLEDFFPKDIFEEITELRVNDNKTIEKEAKLRIRRKRITTDGKLTVLACDHPARNVVKSGDDSVRMGDRYQYLGRILRVITSPEFDGVMGTTDIIEDLLIVNHIMKKRGLKGFLDNKVILGCMNRGGLSGARFEMDDTMTSWTPASIYDSRLDGAKIMVRIDLTNEGSAKTIYYCAQTINELNRLDIPVFLEPLPIEEGTNKVKKNPDDLIKVIGIASALGDSSKGLWLKVPYCEDYPRVVKATTMPLLMLGGESTGDPTGIIGQFCKGMHAGANVRGALVGRNVHFPGKDDPLAVALAVVNVVHKGYSEEEAVKCLMENRDRDMDRLKK